MNAPGPSTLRGIATVASARPPNGWAPVNDHRWHVDPEKGLFLVADASGPTYGGYHAPFGVDPGITTLVAAHSTGMTGEASLLQAFEAAHVEMRRLARLHDTAFETRLRDGVGDRLEASLLAADDVRPVPWARLAGKSLAHFAASISACAFSTGRTLAVAQVGACRAYLCRSGRLELILPDHTLEASPLHSRVVTRLLGFGDTVEVDGATVPVEEGDAVVLCTQSVWARPHSLAALAAQPLMPIDPLEHLVAECAEDEKQDATIVVIAVGGGP